MGQGFDVGYDFDLLCSSSVRLFHMFYILYKLILHFGTYILFIFSKWHD